MNGTDFSILFKTYLRRGFGGTCSYFESSFGLTIPQSTELCDNLEEMINLKSDLGRDIDLIPVPNLHFHIQSG